MKYWSSSDKNIGDAITPFILKKLNINVSLSNLPDVLGAGSILGFDNIKNMSNFAIWGSGYLNKFDSVFEQVKDAQILAVRGKLTAQKLNKQNIIIGDPGLLISKIYQPQSTVKKYKYGIICHCTDYNQIVKDAKKAKINFPIINAQFSKSIEETDIKNFVDLINSCECIFSSSLHGIVFAHAYGIPAIYLKNENNICKNDSHVISQEDFKFKDYYSSLDVEFQSVKYTSDFSFLSMTLNNLEHCPQKDTVIKIQNNLITIINDYNNTLVQQRRNKKAFVIFISSDSYVYYALHIYKNLLDVKSKYQLYCGVTENISEDIISKLKKVGINVFKMQAKDIANSKILKSSADKGMCQSYINAFTKLAILKETQFDKIVYLDTDLWIKENIDELMDKPHMSAVEDLAPCQTHNQYETGCSIFCSGLFVWDFKNNKFDGENIIKLLDSLDPNIQWHDQNVLNYYYNTWIDNLQLHLSPTYGLMTCTNNLNAFGNPKVYHYIITIKNRVPFIDKSVSFSEPLYFYVYDYYKSIRNAISYFNSKYDLKLQNINLTNIKNKNAKVETFMGGGYFGL